MLRVEKTVTHPLSVKGQYDQYDIAVLRLSTSIAGYTPVVEVSNSSEINHVSTLVGLRLPPEGVLQIAQFPVLDVKNCPYLAGMDEHMVCIRSPGASMEAGKDPQVQIQNHWNHGSYQNHGVLESSDAEVTRYAAPTGCDR